MKFPKQLLWEFGPLKHRENNMGVQLSFGGRVQVFRHLEGLRAPHHLT